MAQSRCSNNYIYPLLNQAEICLVSNHWFHDISTSFVRLFPSSLLSHLISCLPAKRGRGRREMARTRNFETPTEGRTMTHVHGQGENHVADGVCRSYETSLLPARDRHPVSTFPRSNVLTCARILILHASKLIIFPQFSRISMLSTSIQFRIDSLCYWNFNQKSVVSSSIVFKRFGSARA